MTINTKKNTDYWFLIIVWMAMFILSIYLFEERIIYTDTSAYLYTLINSETFYIPTNRFSSVLSQILPLTGIIMGFSLKSVAILYSVNFILIPITCSLLCIHLFKDKATALAILLFYLISNMWLFYYPVSEFQMGLCLLLAYHSFLIYFLNNKKPLTGVFVVLSIPIIVTIIFSHPLSMLVFFIWAFWFSFIEKYGSKLLFVMFFISGVVTYGIKELFFKASVKQLEYDNQKMEGLNNFFSLDMISYFDNHLSRTMLKAWQDHYFLTAIIIVILLIFFIIKKSWWYLTCFIGILFGCWLIITVSFQDFTYGHYMEHMYQPITFVIVLILGRYALDIFKNRTIRLLFFTTIAVVSLMKIYHNAEINSNRIKWYENYIGLMQEQKIKKATISTQYLTQGSIYDYWASNCESILISSLASPDSSVLLMVADDMTYFEERKKKGQYFNKKYFNISSSDPYYSLDSLYAPESLNKLMYVK